MPPPRARDEPKVRTHLQYQQLIGWLGFVLPELVYVFAGIFETQGLSSWQVLDSVSAYYYTGAVSVFVGVVFALGVLLVTLPGYEGVKKDRVVAIVGGLGAFGVALLPTWPPGDVVGPGWYLDALGAVHLLGAFLLLGSFAVFALWLFRLSDVPQGQTRPKEKRRRDVVYLVCGILIVVGIVLVPVCRHFDLSIFWPEALAIKAFAVSWLLKGEVYDSKPARSLLRKLGLKEPASLPQS